MEEWKTISVNSNYFISNYGRVKNAKGQIIKPFINHKGYLKISLYNKQLHKSEKFRINRLVAIAFIPNPENLPVVNHIDEDKQNNFVNNLEWCSVKYNNIYSINRRKQKQILMGVQ